MEPTVEAAAAELEELRELVLAAFDQARVRGKTDWQRMRTAVLKNRLLQMSGGRFDQSRYGHGSMSSILSQIPDLVRVSDEFPQVVELIQPERLTDGVQSSAAPLSGEVIKSVISEESKPQSQPHRWRDVRIRDDLWDAILHWENAGEYVWDPDTRIARRKQLTDPETLELPTISPAELANWRRDFVYQRSASESYQMREVLNAWAEGPGAASTLPKVYRGLWMEYLKSSVYKMIMEWFDKRSLVPPAAILLRSESRGVADPKVQNVVQTRQLRSFLVNALESMTYEQMAKIELPAEILLRLHDRG